MLPTDSQERKDSPVYSGVLKYFPLALVEIAKLSKAGNDKHNPGQPLHWSRGKSADHHDCIARHLLEAGTVDPDDGHLHSTKLAWRALAALQLELEAKAAQGQVLLAKDGQAERVDDAAVHGGIPAGFTAVGPGRVLSVEAYAKIIPPASTPGSEADLHRVQ